MKKLLRVLFSRYAISAIFFLLELVCLALVVAYTSSYSYLFFIAAAVINIFFLISLISRDINPEFKVTWAMALCLIPFFGGVLYLIFYSRKLKRKYLKRLRELTLYKPDRSDENILSELKKEDIVSYNQAKMLCNISDTHIYKDTKQTYFSSGEEMYESMLKDLKMAQRFIYLEYFLIEEGTFWNSVLEILTEKSKNGVDVRVLYDDIGCMNTLPGNYAKILNIIK